MSIPQENIYNIKYLIESGDLASAQRGLIILTRQRLSRTDSLIIAKLARQSALWGVALKLLRTYVRPGPKKLTDATVEEKAEYACNLIRLGATQEGMELLKSLNAKKYAPVDLFQAYGYFTTWEYAKAIPYLERYVGSPALSPFELAVGQINLAAAYVITQDQRKAETLLKKLVIETERAKYWRLFGNSLELSAQFYINKKDWTKANKILLQSEKILSKVGGLDLLFTRKWSAIAKALQKPGDKNAQSALKSVREQAVKLKHWETVRDCELFLGVTSPDENRLIRLYFGTSHEKYRQRIFAHYQRPLDVPDNYLLHDGSKKDLKKILDLSTGKISGTTISFPKGQMVMKLFKVFCLDFYRPVSLPHLHSELFPGEYFNPVSSPLRVHQALSRFRKQLSRSGLKAKVILEGKNYRLKLASDMGILIPRIRSIYSKKKDNLEKIFAIHSNSEFSSGDVQKIFNCSPRTAQRLLLDLIEDRKIEKIGASSSTNYRIK